MYLASFNVTHFGGNRRLNPSSCPASILQLPNSVFLIDTQTIRNRCNSNKTNTGGSF
jgi:hypothetical protein